MKKNVYLTLDTETVGGATRPTGTYNFGGRFHTKDEDFEDFSILVMEHYRNLLKDDYGKKNFPIYEEMIKNDKITCVETEEEAFDIILNKCREYGVKYVQAYNSGFDFTKTICKRLLDEYEFIDIYLMALQTITHLKKYRQFCIDNELISKSGKSCATSAESVYAFITNNPNYVEEHTALSDAIIEREIFKYCEKMHKKYTKNCHMFNCKENKCFPSL